MRLAHVLGLLPALVATAACSSSVAEQTGGNSAAVSAGCSASRADILASTSAARQNAIQRGFGWLDANVPYSQSRSHEGYRTDCSGFVSMCWELGTSTNTSALYANGAYDADLGSWDDLLPADALVRKGHVMLFLGWEPGKSGVCVLEQASTASGMQFRVRAVASLRSQGFKPIRTTALADDTGDATGEVAAPVAADPNAPASGSADPATCVPFADVDVCNAAKLTRGLECGLVQNNCGATVSCDSVAGFVACRAPSTCSAAQKCVAPACTPAIAASVCAKAKAADGLQCGTLADGCGGQVNCDDEPGFGCATGETCSISHHCVKVTATTPDDPAASTGAIAPVGDTGDDSAATPAVDDSLDPSKSTTSAPASSKRSTPSMASSGCSASPSNPSSSSNGPGGASRGLLPLLAVLAAATIARRRSQRSRRSQRAA